MLKMVDFIRNQIKLPEPLPEVTHILPQPGAYP